MLGAVPAGGEGRRLGEGGAAMSRSVSSGGAVDARARGSGPVHRALAEGAAAMRGTGPMLLGVYGFAVVVLLVVVGVRLTTGTPVADLVRDPLAVADGPPWLGAVSNLGILVWAVGAVGALFAAAALRRSGAPREEVRFLVAAGVVTTVLLLDDLYMLHETVLPEYVGVPEPVVFGAYGALVGWFVVRFRAAIRRTRWPLALLAAAALAAMVLVDLAGDGVPASGRYLLEDGAKLFAQVGWAAYLVDTGLRAVDARRRPSQREHATGW